jgi:hypothetical protein
VISHIKGTLIQFLKNIPLTEAKNEELLKIIYSMMEFSTNEINELYNMRVTVKVNSKPGKPSSSGNTSASFTNSNDQSKDQPKKGWFGGFGAKKDLSTTADKPIKR